MYKYTQKEDENPLFTFITDSGVTYILELSTYEFENPFFKNLYSLSFYPITNISRVNKPIDDVKIKATILNILTQFLESNQQCIIQYICDSLDNRQHSRNRLFNKWFQEANNSKFYHKLNLNYETEEINYNLEFIFSSNSYNIEDIKESINLQLEEFSEFK